DAAVRGDRHAGRRVQRIAGGGHVVAREGLGAVAGERRHGAGGQVEQAHAIVLLVREHEVAVRVEGDVGGRVGGGRGGGRRGEAAAPSPLKPATPPWPATVEMTPFWTLRITWLPRSQM